ncbi:sodium-coupled neutral amino acid transporter 9 isoform X2 [Rhinatrema bivittatum]|uniref:sodium-coupled neutral amino acid transporter 9 isoform X2 n=1 Tax=Rhinatrema bivittatum TaxID=194408 RepID=UPI00112B8765|nr:sodium-coupled neutral amino acid transporter 9 isoform X2 [Rhinatrema bivittatum]
MDDDAASLLDPVTFAEHDAGVEKSLFDPRSRRPFHVEPTNITSINGDDPQRVTAQASAMSTRIQYYGKLASSSERALIAPDHVIPDSEDIFVYSPLGSAIKVGGDTDSSGENSSIVTIFMIWNTMMGTSVLSIPWGIKQAGFTTGVCILILMGVLTLYCCYRILKSRAIIPDVDTSSWEFPEVCKYYFGTFGQWSSLLFSMVSLVGAMVVYWVLMSNFLFNTGQFIYIICPNFDTDSPGHNSTEGVSANGTELQQFEMWWSKTHTVPFYLIMAILPLLNFKSPSFFAKFNVLGTLSVFYLIFLVTLKSAHLGFHLDFHWAISSKYFVPEFRLSFPQLTGVLTLAFFLHNSVITLLKNNRNQAKNVRDLSIAYFLVGLTYLYVGAMIFAAFPSPPLSKECIQQNFLDNFPSNDVMSFVARIFLLFQMITVYPLLCYLMRVQLLGHVFGKTYPSIFHVLALNVAVVGAGVLMARFNPNIGGIIRYSGATCGLALVFVYPALIHLISLYRTGTLKWPTLVFHVFLMVLGLANLISQFFM